MTVNTRIAALARDCVIHGDMTPAAERALLTILESARRPMKPLDSAKCGTNAQARAHQRRDETPCRACREAAARYRQDRVRDKK